MELLFKTRSEEFTGPGSLPNGSLDDTSSWQPMTKYLEAGAENYPEKAIFIISLILSIFSKDLDKSE